MNKTGRNDSCPCGSGKKFKQCCMRSETATRPSASASAATVAAQLQLAFASQMAGRLHEAETTCRSILHNEPRNADALHLLGVVTSELGDHERAIELIGKAIHIAPSKPSYHANLARVLINQNRLDKAEACLRRALALKPASEYYNGLGNVLRAQGKWDEAARNYQRALNLNANFAEAHGNLGDLFQLQGRYDEAIAAYRRALALNPGAAEIHGNLGALLKTLQRSTEAIECYRQAIALDPGNTLAHRSLGTLLLETGDLESAITSFEKVLASEPDFAQASDDSSVDELIGSSIHESLLHVMSIAAGCPPKRYHDAACEYGQRLMKVARPFAQWPASARERGQPLRVGLLSADFRGHPVGFFLENILAHIDPARIELVGYSANPLEDELTARIRPHFAAWHSVVELTNAAAARNIHGDGIHVLIDLGGYTANSRVPILAWKPAPVQASWLGYWASTGLPTIDYIVCDPHSLTATETAHFIEQPWYLPATRLCFTPPQDDIPVAPLPALANGHVTFGCFNNPTKMNDAVVALWARLLLRVERSRLILKSKLFDDESLAQLTRQRFAAHGIAADRIMLQPKSARADYLRAYDQIDIALDPFPFTGATTSVEGVWMGVPLITLRGDRLIAHQGESILGNLQLHDWIAANEDDYVEIAAAHARDLPRLASLREQLRERLLESPLCDAAAFARNFEAALEGMWEGYTKAAPD